MTTSSLPRSDRRSRSVAFPMSGAPAARSAVAGLSIVGAAALIGGSLGPWLSIYAGLRVFRGIDAENGQVLAGLGILIGVIGLLQLSTRATPALRWVLAAVAFAATALAAVSVIGLLSTLRDLSAEPLLLAAPGPGLFFALAGGVIGLATVFLPIPAASATADPDAIPDAVIAGAAPTLTTRSIPAAGVLAGLLAIGAAIHLALLPDHLAEGWLGIAFLGSGLVQLRLAQLVLGRPARSTLQLAAVLSAIFALAYLMAVTTGLPGLGSTDAATTPAVGATPPAAMNHESATGPLGPVEAVGEAGVLAVVVELGAAALALGLAGRRRGSLVADGVTDVVPGAAD